MKKKLLLIFPFVFLLGSTHAQQQSGEIVSDISGDISSLELPPIKLDLGLGYQSNIDLLDPTQYKIKYKDNAIINVGGSAKMQSEILGNALSYSTAITALVFQANDYDRSSDVLRRVNFNNNFFVNLLSEDSNLSFGPTLDLIAEKRYAHQGFHRKRDNVTGFIGLKSDLRASSQLMLSSSIAAGYHEHSGNYVDLNSARRIFEHQLEEDRSIYKANITSVFKANSVLTLSMPISYQRDNFTEKRARAARTGYVGANLKTDEFLDLDLASWSTKYNQPYMDESLDIQNIAAGLGADLTFSNNINASMAYTFVDDREMNEGHGRNNSDTDSYAMSLSSDLDMANIALSYSQDNVKWNYMAGGSSEITQTYATDVKLATLLKDISTNLRFSYTDYQFSDATGYTEKAKDVVAMVGISTTL